MAKSFYTQNGWEGELYQQTKSLALKEIARRIKAEFLSLYPTLSISTRTHYFSGGQSIECEITKVDFEVYKKEIMPQFWNDYADKPEAEIPKWVYNLQYTEKAQAIIDSIRRIGDKYRYNDSDGQIDYFDTNFYYTPDFSYAIRQSETARLGLGGD